MSYCPHCGKEVYNKAVICVNCGCSLKANSTPAKNDSPDIGYALLGFFIPVVGLILYLIWKDETPLRAKSAGKGALISVIISVVLFVIYMVFIAVIFSTLFSTIASTSNGIYFS